MKFLDGWQCRSDVIGCYVVDQPKQNWPNQTGVEKNNANLSKGLHTAAHDAATAFIHLSCRTHHLYFKHHPLGHFA
ncbi:MAG: hypothetical protein U0350_27595 [Caldilineaceae bacterium]